MTVWKVLHEKKNNKYKFRYNDSNSRNLFVLLGEIYAL